MNNSTGIKLGGVTNLTDARYAAAQGINYIGFCFDANDPGFIPPIKAREIMDWITGSHMVAEFKEHSLSDIINICELIHPDVVEVNNSIPAQDLLSVGLPVIKKINMEGLSETALAAQIESFAEVADAFHLFGTKENISDAFLSKIIAENKIIWGFAFDITPLEKVLSDFKPYAVQLIGSDEEMPGYKDFEELDRLVDLIRPLV